MEARPGLGACENSGLGQKMRTKHGSQSNLQTSRKLLRPSKGSQALGAETEEKFILLYFQVRGSSSACSIPRATTSRLQCYQQPVNTSVVFIPNILGDLLSLYEVAGLASHHSLTPLPTPRQLLLVNCIYPKVTCWSSNSQNIDMGLSLETESFQRESEYNPIRLVSYQKRRSGHRQTGVKERPCEDVVGRQSSCLNATWSTGFCYRSSIRLRQHACRRGSRWSMLGGAESQHEFLTEDEVSSLPAWVGTLVPTLRNQREWSR